MTSQTSAILTDFNEWHALTTKAAQFCVFTEALFTFANEYFPFFLRRKSSTNNFRNAKVNYWCEVGRNSLNQKSRASNSFFRALILEWADWFHLQQTVYKGPFVMPSSLDAISWHLAATVPEPTKP